MSAFDVKVGKSKPAKTGAKPPSERKPIHPGLRAVATDHQCLKCGTFLEFRGLEWRTEFLGSPPWEHVWVAFCGCGIWVRDQRAEIRWIRFSSAPFLPDGKPLTAPSC